MPNTIKIKSGTGTPSANQLVANELGFSTDQKKLYIGVNGEDPFLINEYDGQAVSAQKITDSSNNTLTVGSTSKPVYFNSGVPAVCNSLTADKLSVNAGDLTTPVYFDNGVPTVCIMPEVFTQTDEPTNVKEGDIWIDTDAEGIEIIDNGPEIYTQTTEPTEAVEGDIWINPEINSLGESIKSVQYIAQSLDDNQKLQARTNIGAPSIEKLWENASPTSAFAAQTISLDLSSYTHIVVIGALNNSASTYMLPAAVIPIGVDGSILAATCTYGYYNYDRLFSTSTTGVTFQASRYTQYAGSNDGTDNQMVIPRYILGIKGVS